MRRRAKELQKLSPGSPRKKGRVNLPEGSDNIVPFPAEPAQVRDELANQAGVGARTPSYAIRGPGSWEANKPFELSFYIGPDSGFADRWFEADRIGKLSPSRR
jgi:hypothetical protein